jgi:hypothetical protein
MIKNRIAVLVTFIGWGILATTSVTLLDWYGYAVEGFSLKDYGFFGVIPIGDFIVAFAASATHFIITYIHDKFYRELYFISVFINVSLTVLVESLTLYLDVLNDGILNFQFASFNSINISTYFETIFVKYQYYFENSPSLSIIYTLFIIFAGSVLGSGLTKLRKTCHVCRTYSKKIKGDVIFFSSQDNQKLAEFLTLIRASAHEYYVFKKVFSHYKENYEISASDAHFKISYQLNVCPNCNNHLLYVDTEKKSGDNWSNVKDLSSIHETEYNYLGDIQFKSPFKK